MGFWNLKVHPQELVSTKVSHPKQFQLMGTKYSNIWAYRCYLVQITTDTIIFDLMAHYKNISPALNLLERWVCSGTVEEVMYTKFKEAYHLYLKVNAKRGRWIKISRTCAGTCQLWPWQCRQRPKRMYYSILIVV